MCCKAIFDAWYVENIEEQRGRSKRYYESSEENRQIHINGSRRWRIENPGMGAAATRRWQENNPEKVKEWYEKTRDIRNLQQRTRRKNNPDLFAQNDKKRRARKRNAPVCDLTTEEWEFIKKLYDYRCAYCGKKMKRLTQDHITPLSKGGSHTMVNIVPACRSCNSKKHVGPPLKPVQPSLPLGL